MPGGLGHGIPRRTARVPVECEGDTLLITFARDISERKKEETRIQRLNEDLESRVRERTIELVKTTRQERDRVESELLAARSAITRLEKELEQLRRERDLVKNKVESLLENLSEITEETVV